MDVPLSIPSAALGFAVFMFWGPAGLNIAEPGIGLIIFVHITFTFPFLVRPIMATIKNIQVGNEEASAVFGASSLTTFRKITLPAIKNGIIAGTIAAFTRSLGETGVYFSRDGGRSDYSCVNSGLGRTRRLGQCRISQCVSHHIWNYFITNSPSN